MKAPGRSVFFALFLLAGAPARADGDAPRAILLKAARLFDSRTGTIVVGGRVLVENGRISAVGKAVREPKDAQTIDLGDATLLPGLVDAHTHLTGEMTANWYKDVIDGLLRPKTEQAHYAALYARRTLEAGVTTVRDLGADEWLDIGLRNAIEAGLLVGPRMLVAGHAVGARGGHGDGLPIPLDRLKAPGVVEGVCNGADSCREAVRWQIKYGADVIKLVPSGGVLSLGDPVDAPELSQDEMNAIVEEAHHWGRKAAAHCHGDAAARMAIKAGVDSIEHGTFLKPDTLAQMKARGVYLMPGPLAAGDVPTSALPPPIQEKARLADAQRPRLIKAALAAGVKIAFGTDAAVNPHGKNARELGALVSLGMTPAAALRSATAVSAELLGLGAKVGSLEKGKLADIIAVPGDPLADIHRTEQVFFVMKDGRVVKRGSLPPEAQPARYLIKAARLFDGRSNTNLAGAAVLVENNKIVAVGRDLLARAPVAGTQVIDLGDATLLPGFIDAHVHLGFESSENWYRDAAMSLLRFPTEQAHYAATYAKKTLEAGFTTVRNLGGHDDVDSGLRNAINAGLLPGPRMLVARYPIGVTGGHADGFPIPLERVAHGRGPDEGICNSPEECRAAVRWQIRYGADVIKLMPSGGVLSLSDPVDVPQLTQDEVNAIVDEAHRWNRKAAAHCHGDVAAKMAIRAGVDSLEHGSFLQPDTLALMKARGVFLVPTAMANATVKRKAAEGKFPPAIAVKARAAAAAHEQMFKNALQAGVRIALGTDSAVSLHGDNAHELTLMVGMGMPAAAALRAATADAAELLGVKDTVGTIEKGKLADLIAVPGDPLTDIRKAEHVSFVMKDGKVVKNEATPATH